MNRNMKGERFSRAELVAMAVEIGATTAEEVTVDAKAHVFERMTKEHRLALFMRGEAILDTRPEPSKATGRAAVDMEVLACLGVVL